MHFCAVNMLTRVSSLFYGVDAGGTSSQAKTLPSTYKPFYLSLNIGSVDSRRSGLITVCLHTQQTHTYTHIYTYLSQHTHIHTYVNTHTYYIHTYIQAYILLYIYIYIYIYIYTHTHTHTCTHTHTHTQHTHTNIRISVPCRVRMVFASCIADCHQSYERKYYEKRKT